MAYRWQPIKGLDSQSVQVDFQELDSLHQQWTDFREQREASNPDAYKAFKERIERSWAIETGIIEGLYDIGKGVTQTLVENGLIADLIDREATNRDPQELIKVLKDHQNTAKFVTECIELEEQLSINNIRQLHQLLTLNQPTYTARDQDAREFETKLDRGGFKTQRNSRTRKNEEIQDYCPPEQVASELDNLINWYNEFQQNSAVYHPILVAAWLHHGFTQIHPFQDGNGRVARALLTWHLAKENYLPVVISRNDRERYIDVLESADDGDLSPFALFLVQLERRTILEALGEPEPVAASGIVDQVVDHIVEQIRRQNQNKQTQMRSVNNVAHNLCNSAVRNLVSRGDQICQRLRDAGLSIERSVDRGGPNDREHWYRAGVVQTAREAHHWANLNESRYFVSLSINPEDQARTPSLNFVISLHHVGQQLTGIMAATAFAQIRDSRSSDRDSRESDAEGLREPAYPYFEDCTVDPFTFTWQDKDDTEAIAPRFAEWVEGRLSVALRYWSEFIS